MRQSHTTVDIIVPLGQWTEHIYMYLLKSQVQTNPALNSLQDLLHVD